MTDVTRMRDPVETILMAKKKSRLLYVAIILLAVAVFVLVYFLFFNHPGGARELSPKLRQMNKLISKIRNLETDVTAKENEIFGLIKDYNQKTGESLTGLNSINLSDEEKKILEDKINNEKDITLKSLLSDILERNQEISELRGKIKLIEALLPKPHIAARGENHYQIAMDFLLNEKGVEKERAVKLVERAALFEPLVPEFKVWNFYSGEEYGTFITQGNAPISPNAIRRQAKKKLVDEMDTAISERDKLAAAINALGTRRDQIVSQLDYLNREKRGLIKKMSELYNQNRQMQETINSLFFLLEPKKNLFKKGIIKGGFLRSPRLRDVSPEYFRDQIDLRKENSIKVSARKLNLKKIKRINLYPKFFRKGVDYRVTIEENKQAAVLTILDLDKFKNEKVVISVE